MDNKELTLKTLQDMGLKYEIIEHEIVHTIEDMEAAGITQKCDVCKNFFLRDAKGKRHFVVTLPKDKQINIQDIAKQIGSTRLSFGSDERLSTHLKLVAGQVGPLSVINNPEKTVEYVFDKDLKDAKNLGIHPNDNSATLIMDFDEIIKVVKKDGHKVFYIKA